MAILENLPGIKATVVADGTTNEYNDDSDWALREHIFPPQGFRQSQYIQVIDDAEFKVKIEVDIPDPRVDSDLNFIAE